MLELEKRINDDLKETMKNGLKDEVQIYRFLLAQIKDERIKLRPKRELNEEDIVKVLTSTLKKSKESAEIYQKSQRAELAEKELAEIAIIEKYLPEQLSEEELKKIIAQVIEQSGASSMKDMGKVMGPVMAKVSGKADGKIVQNLVRSQLS